jgi:hypothetical protein
MKAAVLLGFQCEMKFIGKDYGILLPYVCGII